MVRNTIGNEATLRQEWSAEKVPRTTLECPCGKVITAANEDELVRKTQDHLRSEHPGHEYTREQILMFAR